MDLLRLRSFVESARLGSFAAAAEALGYTAPAVSQHIAHLENELQCELLVRGARGVRLTTPGAVLLERADRLLAETQMTVLAVRESAGQLRSLRVGTFPSAAHHLVPEALGRLRAAHPDLELALMHYEPPDGLTQLAAGEVDAVVTHRYPGVSWSAPTGVRTATLIADPLLLMVAADHPLAERTRVDLGKLRDETFISGTTADPNRIALAAASAGAGFAPHVAFETADYAATASLVRSGFGIAVVPRLAWPSDVSGIAQLSLHTTVRRIFARRLLLAVRTGRVSALVSELARNLTEAAQTSMRLSSSS
jgi:DNA-binding transcriptional LysR family regulator